MNGYERVMTTLRHEEPDRVPMFEWGIPANGIPYVVDHPIKTDRDLDRCQRNDRS